MNGDERAFIKPRPPIFVLDPHELYEKLNLTADQIRFLTNLNLEFLENEARAYAEYYRKLKEFFIKA